jgi:hypothetical protein
MIDQTILEEQEEYSEYTLANMADVVSAEGEAGAFLLQVRDSYWEYARYDADGTTDWHDTAHEIADGAVPVYTSNLWETFVALRAWHEDVSEFGPIEDMTRGAQIAIFMIAERLVMALAEEAGAL